MVSLLRDTNTSLDRATTMKVMKMINSRINLSMLALRIPLPVCEHDNRGGAVIQLFLHLSMQSSVQKLSLTVCYTTTTGSYHMQ